MTYTIFYFSDFFGTLVVRNSKKMEMMFHTMNFVPQKHSLLRAKAIVEILWPRRLTITDQRISLPILTSKERIRNTIEPCTSKRVSA